MWIQDIKPCRDVSPNLLGPYAQVILLDLGPGSTV